MCLDVAGRGQLLEANINPLLIVRFQKGIRDCSKDNDLSVSCRLKNTTVSSIHHAFGDRKRNMNSLMLAYIIFKSTKITRDSIAQQYYNYFNNFIN